MKGFALLLFEVSRNAPNKPTATLHRFLQGYMSKRNPTRRAHSKIAYEKDDNDTNGAKGSKRSRKTQEKSEDISHSADVVYSLDGEGKKPETRHSPTEPKNWDIVWDRIKQMREKKDAPVDLMGCDKLHDSAVDAKVQRYQILTALMLSSQTKDPVTADAMKNLVKHGLTVDNILTTDEKTLDSLICKVGFHNKKTIYIKQTAEILRDKYESDIPPTIEGLLELPGVGKKMAYLTMLSAWNKCVGIGVDVHVHRISARLGWTKKAKDPEDTRLQLEDWLPNSLWSEINELLVGFGQTICAPVNPKCASCSVSELCPSSSVKKTKHKKAQE